MRIINVARSVDDRDLEILARHDIDGHSFQRIADDFGLTRSAVAGMVRRIRRAEAGHPCVCTRPENRDILRTHQGAA